MATSRIISTEREGRGEGMQITCVEGHWHEVSPTGLAVIVQAFMDGDMQQVGRKGIFPLCLKKAFTDSRVRDFMQRYAGNAITIDKDKK
jgi:hypothetical protein